MNILIFLFVSLCLCSLYCWIWVRSWDEASHFLLPAETYCLSRMFTCVILLEQYFIKCMKRSVATCTVTFLSLLESGHLCISLHLTCAIFIMCTQVCPPLFVPSSTVVDNTILHSCIKDAHWRVFHQVFLKIS